MMEPFRVIHSVFVHHEHDQINTFGTDLRP
jgi:hypothetical protein